MKHLLSPFRLTRGRCVASVLQDRLGSSLISFSADFVLGAATGQVRNSATKLSSSALSMITRYLIICLQMRLEFLNYPFRGVHNSLFVVFVSNHVVGRSGLER